MQTQCSDSGSSSPHLSSVVLGLVNTAATLLSSLLVDRLGRRVLLFLSSAGMAASLAVLGAHHYTQAADTTVPLLALLSYITSFSLGFGPVSNMQSI